MFELKCDWCGKPIKKYVLHKHNFCSRQCLADFSNKSKNPSGYSELKNYENISQHMTELNKELNPDRMTDDVREKIRKSKLDSGAGKTYRKLYSSHEHRRVAAEKIGRALLPGEVVHHIDGNKRNNNPDNLVVFASQAEHAHHHAELSWFLRELERLEGGEAR